MFVDLLAIRLLIDKTCILVLLATPILNVEPAGWSPIVMLVVTLGYSFKSRETIKVFVPKLTSCAANNFASPTIFKLIFLPAVTVNSEPKLTVTVTLLLGTPAVPVSAKVTDVTLSGSVDIEKSDAVTT